MGKCYYYSGDKLHEYFLGCIYSKKDKTDDSADCDVQRCHYDVKLAAQ